MGKHKDLARFHDIECQVTRKRHAEDSEDDSDLGGFLTDSDSDESDTEDSESSSGSSSRSDEEVTPLSPVREVPVHRPQKRTLSRQRKGSRDRTVLLSGKQRNRVLPDTSEEEEDKDEDEVTPPSPVREGTSSGSPSGDWSDTEQEEDGVLMRVDPVPHGDEAMVEVLRTSPEPCQDMGEEWTRLPCADVLLAPWDVRPLTSEAEKLQAQEACELEEAMGSVSLPGAQHFERSIVDDCIKKETASAYGVGLREELSQPFKMSAHVVDNISKYLRESFGKNPERPALRVLPEERECEMDWMHNIRGLITRQPGSFTEACHPVPFESVMVRTAVGTAPAVTE